jgi:branched-chain amino acid transport system substrate-binding protein
MRRFVLLCAVALCACPLASTGQGASDQPRVEVKPSAVADEALKQAGLLADSKSRKESVEAYLAVRKAYPETIAGQEALVRAGLLAFEEGDYVTARKRVHRAGVREPAAPTG